MRRATPFLMSFAAATAVALTVSAAPALADSHSVEERLAAMEEQLNEQRALIQAQQRQLEQYHSMLEQRVEGLEDFRGRGVTPTAEIDRPESGDPSAGAVAQDAAPQQQQPQQQQPQQQQPPTAQPTFEPPPEERPEVAAIADQGGVLLPQGRLVVEPSLEYSLSNVNRVEIAGFSVLPAIIIGSFEVSQAERRSVTAATTVRYGVTDRLELEARVPYVYRSDRLTRRELGTGASEPTTDTIGGSDLGDIEVAAHYQLNQPAGSGPFYVANLRFKSRTGQDPFSVSRDDDGRETELPTGSGFYSIQPSLTAIYPSDPAVFYGNVSYAWNMKRNVGGEFGTIDPGDSVGLNLGMGISLNERTSFNVAYDHQYIFSTTGDVIEDTRDLQVGRLLVGGSYRFSDRTSVNLSVGIGVTEDAPDLTATVRVPISFDLF